MKKIRMGVIGIGNMGSEHCRNIVSGLCPEIELTAVADLRADRRAWAAEALPGSVQAFESGSELIRNHECDAVLIATPHFQHEEIALEALDNGLNVLCEKPMSVTVTAGRQMIQAAQRTKKTLALMFNQRTNCLYRAIKRELDNGIFGRIKRVSWIVTDWYRTQRYYDSGDWRATWAGEGGGVLLNQCPHQLDLLIWLCGMPVLVEAKCHEGKWHHIEVEDDVTVYLEFGNGATGTFVTSTGDLPGTNRLEIDCERGKMVCEDGKVKCLLLNENERDICFQSDDPWYQSRIRAYELDTDGMNPQHAGVLNAFAAHLLRGEPLTATAEDGLKALMLSNAIHYSGWTGTAVRIPAPEEAFNRMLAQKAAGSPQKKTGNITYQTDHTGSGSGSRE